MTYRTEFPDFDADGAAKLDSLLANPEAWVDVSWHNDTCPSIMCDVFVLYADYADPTQREFEEAPRFTMHCEDVILLMTDDWADVLAFINDGKRDFPEYRRIASA